MGHFVTLVAATNVTEMRLPIPLWLGRQYVLQTSLGQVLQVLVELTFLTAMAMMRFANQLHLLLAKTVQTTTMSQENVVLHLVQQNLLRHVNVIAIHLHVMVQ